MPNRWGNNENSDRLYILGQMVIAIMKLKDACSLEKSYDQPRQCIKKQRHYLLTKVHLVIALVYPVVMYGCVSWTINKES